MFKCRSKVYHQISSEMRKLGVQHVLTLVLTISGPALGSRIRFPDEFIGSEHPGGEFMDKIDEKEKHIRKAFGMSYIEYFNLNKQFYKTVAELKSG